MSTEHHVQGIPISRLAEEFGTPMYVYDADVLCGRYGGLREALHPSLEFFYSLKANPNISVYSVLRRAGARAEVSSLTELRTAQRAGAAAEDIIFLGPGKSREELEACVEDAVYAVVCESIQEMRELDEIAERLDRDVDVLLRVNPSFTVKGSGLTMGGKPRQFGIDEERLLSEAGLLKGFPRLRCIGVHVYMGTRILSSETIVRNTERILDLAERLSVAMDFPLKTVDVGGGLGVGYFQGEDEIDLVALADGLNPLIEGFLSRRPDTRMIMESGRYLAAPAGMYVVGVRYVKTSMGERFAVADGGTNHHMAAVGIGSFVKRNFPMRLLDADTGRGGPEEWNVTGPLCTPNDTLGKRVSLPPLRQGDLIGVERSGAYGPTASPVHFLSHGHPAEVLVLDGRPHLVRERDRVEDMLGRQFLAPGLERGGAREDHR
ncbi:diaminopimelate decarboxylase [Nocardiopsis alba]|uniref:diaminopimelate decarboxylase n=1 Tax=Nocardiopsis alba TaxID=53437 RepID=UPI0035DB2CD7